ncbi:hypothetical protein [Amphibacillus cookii]|uniref:family 4 glycosyl hydrolase n=1 Tax=Amphibacillus cookii TaxID=767787 RepID=UPI0023BAD81A|nr:hypothetical protein [Amphibacillus cookii]MBM7543230.1 alpha-galactosidase/6-phospho-beta-glucosidase family protein [Amphibacillus cookii]
MKQGVKIVTIGGGSSYTPELMEGFIKRYEELPISEMWLVSGDTAKQVLDELLIAHKRHLPQFTEKIAELEAKGVTVKDEIARDLK